MGKLKGKNIRLDDFDFSDFEVNAGAEELESGVGPFAGEMFITDEGPGLPKEGVKFIARVVVASNADRGPHINVQIGDRVGTSYSLPAHTGTLACEIVENIMVETMSVAELYDLGFQLD